MTQNTINQTDEFINWLNKLKDPQSKAGIILRLKRAENGNFGDHKMLPDTGGVYEMRIFKGQGYRVYYAKQDKTVYLLLCGGSKNSQAKDITHATQMWQTIKQQLKNSS